MPCIHPTNTQAGNDFEMSTALIYSLTKVSRSFKLFFLLPPPFSLDKMHHHLHHRHDHPLLTQVRAWDYEVRCLVPSTAHVLRGLAHFDEEQVIELVVTVVKGSMVLPHPLFSFVFAVYLFSASSFFLLLLATHLLPHCSSFATGRGCIRVSRN